MNATQVNSRGRGCTLSSALFLAAAATAHAQCPSDWMAEPGSGYSGTNGNILAIQSFDADGAGPLPASLIIGGDFSQAGDLSVSRIAAWNGTSWDTMAGGVSGTSVSSMIEYQGDLIIAGSFTSAGSVSTPSLAARWDGTSWTAMGDGSIVVSSLRILNGELIATGSATSGPAISPIVRWNGSAWEELVPGLASPFSSSSVGYPTAHGGELYVSGSALNNVNHTVGRVFKLVGSSWQQVGADFSIAPILVSTGADLFAGGGYQFIGGQPVNRVAKWNGSAWQQAGAGVDGTVRVMYSHNGQVIAFGDASGYVSRFNGTSWQYIVSSLQGNHPATVYSFGTHNGELVMGGVYVGVNQIGVDGLATWNGMTWSAIDAKFNGAVHAFASAGGTLYAGGLFSNANGATGVSNIAQRNGDTWSAMGTGVNGWVHAMISDGDDVIVGGGFSIAGGNSHPALARWDGSTWGAVGPTITGELSSVYTFERYNGDLIVGGEFGTSTGSPSNDIARFDGTAWHALGTGSNGSVSALEVYNGDLFAAGNFTNMGGVTARRIARWDGSAWSAIGTGVNNSSYISAIKEYNGELYAAGHFTTINGVSCFNIAKWNGSTWQSPGLGLQGTDDVWVHSLEVRDGKLIATGEFHTAGTVAASNIAAWDGTSWSQVGTGLNGGGSALIVHEGVLQVGGAFKTAGGLISPYIAQFGCPCPSDFDGSGFSDIEDFGAFVAAFELGDDSADVDGSGFVDIEDYTKFVELFEAGC